LNRGKAKPVAAKSKKSAASNPLSTAKLTESVSLDAHSTNAMVIDAPYNPTQLNFPLSNDDLVSMHTIPDLYDPSLPNNYYDTVYKAKKLLMEASIAFEEQDEPKQDLEPNLSSSASSNFGAKMLYKQGWKGTGYGLGKSEQGMTTPLIGFEASSTLGDGSVKTIGAIAHAPTRIEASTVVVLRNMVLRGHIDEELANETALACAPYGQVLQCIIQEENDHNICLDDEAVRIFVKFESTMAAQRAKSALNGKRFDGRPVQANSYPEAAFEERKYWVPIRPDL
jgi:hypothetical protein